MGVRVSFVLALLLLSICSQGAKDVLSVWKSDIKHQIQNNRPKIEARYADPTRKIFEVESDRYKLLIDLQAETGQRISKLLARGYKEKYDIVAGNGIYLRLTDSGGTIYSSLNTREASRINIYRRGPYYIESHWLDVQLCDSEGTPAPVKGEVVFYSYPEKTHVQVIFHITSPIEVNSAGIAFELDAENCASMAECPAPEEIRLNNFLLIQRKNNSPTYAFIYPVPNGVDDVVMEKTDYGVRVHNYIYNKDIHDSAPVKWNEGDKPSTSFELMPLHVSEPTPELEAEIRPLMFSNFNTTQGRALGYDPIRGCYKIQTDNPGYFSYHYYENRNDYETAAFSVRNDDLLRKIYILHETRQKPGHVECGVVLDRNGDALPITVQISKNFDGEKEEPFYNPKDIPFSETFFPLYLQPQEERLLTSLHLYQNWGNHPLKQFSSLGAWMDYYHMSTGVTETTCYVPFLFGGPGGVNIADLRPMSQKLWESQPQHDNIAGHSFLRYLDSEDKWHYLEYVGTTFRSTGPNWADMSMDYISDDGAAKVRLDVFELPQTDELRNFIRMRIDFLKDINVKDGDFGRYMRLLNIASWVQQMRYTEVAYGGPTGEIIKLPIKLGDDFTLAGTQLPAENAFATVYPDYKGANAYIIRQFKGSIGGKPVTPGISVYGQNNGDTILMLVPVTEAKDIKAGDFIEADLFIMPYGDGVQDARPAQKAAFDYGLNAPKVTSVTRGEKTGDFPTRITLDSEGRAEFSVTGGFNYIPIIIEGAKDYYPLRLYNIDSEKTLVNHSQPGKKDGYQVYTRDDGTFGFVFLVNTDGKEHRYLVE